MAKPKYRLDVLLRVKQRAKQRAELALAKAIIELKNARDTLEKLQDEKTAIIQRWHETRDDMHQQMRQGGVINDGTRFVNFLRKLKEDEDAKAEEIVAQEQVIVRCEEKVARRRRDYLHAAQEMQVMEKHKELWVKREQALLTAKEEKEFDELGQTIHELRKWRARGIGETQVVG